MNKLELNSLITINKKNKKKINKHTFHTHCSVVVLNYYFFNRLFK